MKTTDITITTPQQLSKAVASMLSTPEFAKGVMAELETQATDKELLKNALYQLATIHHVYSMKENEVANNEAGELIEKHIVGDDNLKNAYPLATMVEDYAKEYEKRYGKFDE